MAEELKVTVFGTSAKYLDLLSKSYSPNQQYKLEALTQILSTGSPLKAELYDWCYENIKKDMLLGSITGGMSCYFAPLHLNLTLRCIGTDICSLFMGHNTALPVYRGEVQCRNLGMAMECWSEEGKRLDVNLNGDLVCTKAFPCMVSRVASSVALAGSLISAHSPSASGKTRGTRGIGRRTWSNTPGSGTTGISSLLPPLEVSP